MRGLIGALAAVCAGNCVWGLDHDVGLDYWNSFEEPSFRQHSAIWPTHAGDSAGPGFITLAGLTATKVTKMRAITSSAAAVGPSP